MSKIKKHIWIIVVLLIASILPFTNSTILISIGVVAFIYSIAALGLNVVVGWTGLLDLGSAGFTALGAYITAILLINSGMSFIWIFIIAIILGFTIGIILGIPTLRHRSDYFAILTLGFAELVSLLIRNWTPVTGGAYGLANIPNLNFLGYSFSSLPPIGYYFLSLFLLTVVFILLIALRNSKLGRFFHIIKNNEDVAKVNGINPVIVKILAFGISASIISISGVIWASYYSALTWSQFDVLLSCIFLSLIIVGGSGNIKGVLIGAVLVSSSIEIIRILLVNNNLPQNIRFLIFSLLLIIFIRLKPKGLIPDKPFWIKSLNFKNKENFKREPKNKKTKAKILICENITKSFDGIRAIKNLSFDICENEIIGILGPNGSGKTTILNLISGLLSQDSGKITFQSKDISKIKPHKRAQLGIRRSFQHHFVFDDISSIDNILLPIKRELSISRNMFISELLEKNNNSQKLSFGQKKIIDVLRLLVNAPDYSLLLMDEPTSGLNQKEASEVLSLLKSYMQNTQCSIVIVSHDVKFLENIELDRAIILNSGEKFAEGKISDLKNNKNVQEIFWT